jgi:hypothetical protein
MMKKAYGSLSGDEEDEEGEEAEDLGAVINKLYQQAKQKETKDDILRISRGEMETREWPKEDIDMGMSFNDRLDKILSVISEEDFDPGAMAMGRPKPGGRPDADMETKSDVNIDPKSDVNIDLKSDVNIKSRDDIRETLAGKAEDTIGKVKQLSAGLQAFLNGQMVVGELQTIADEAAAAADDLQRDASILKKHAGFAEAVRKIDPELSKIVRRWSAIAQHGREAGEGRTAMSSFPMLTKALAKAIENWKADKGTESAFNLWEVAGELASQAIAIKDQVRTLINRIGGNRKARMAKRPARAQADVGSSGTKVAKQLAAKLIGGTQRGISREEVKLKLKEKLEELVSVQGYKPDDIARIYGSTPEAVNMLMKYSGAASEQDMSKPSETPKYKVVGGEVFGGEEDYYKKLWRTEAEKVGVDDEVVKRVLIKMRERGGPIDPKELADELGIDEAQAASIISKFPLKTDVTATEAKRILLVSTEPGNSRDFKNSVRAFDGELFNETIKVTEAIEAILELIA